MSFRTRLTLFFLLIVALPMVAVAVLVTEVAGESSTGKADARLSAALAAAISVYEDELDHSRRAARMAARDEELASTLTARDPAGLRSVAGRLRSELQLVSVTLLGAGGRELAHAGSSEAVAEA